MNLSPCPFIEEIKEFLQENWSFEKPLLLAYSGGPDSKALLYALLEAGVTHIHLAHVDHGWREESRNECEELRAEADQLGIPFHATRLLPPKGGNREANARKERLHFFRSLFNQFDFEALLLGHQADDVAETILKRVFEGAHIQFLGGMEMKGELEGMPFWRPLLKTPKSKILRFLQERNLIPFFDATNSDPAYLRSRMRTDLFPYLTSIFGKEIRENLNLLGQRSFELSHYLDKKVMHHPMIKGPWGIAVDLNSMERIERRHLIQKLKQGIPRTLLDPILDWVQEGRADKLIVHGGESVCIDRGWIFVLSSNLPRFEAPVILEEGVFRSGNWQIEVIRSKAEKNIVKWPSIWTGEFSYYLPLEQYELKMPYQIGNKNHAKVPAFFRRTLPVIYQGREQVFDFMTGNALPEKGWVLKLILRIVK